MEDDEPPQGNRLIAPIKNSKVAAIFSETILCRIGMHQGTWTTEACQRRRFCIYCGRLQQHEIHVWASDSYIYIKDGSCETMATCLRCGKTVIAGIHHVGISFWNDVCKRCGEYLGSVDIY